MTEHVVSGKAAHRVSVEVQAGVDVATRGSSSRFKGSCVDCGWRSPYWRATSSLAQADADDHARTSVLGGAA